MQLLHPVLFQRAGRMEKHLFFHFVKMCQLAYTSEVGLLEPASATKAVPLMMVGMSLAWTQDPIGSSLLLFLVTVMIPTL